MMALNIRPRSFALISVALSMLVGGMLLYLPRGPEDGAEASGVLRASPTGGKPAAPAESPPTLGLSRQVEGAAFLAGLARLQDGFPLGDWPLRLVPVDQPDPLQDEQGALTVRTDADGRFLLSPVPEGDYRVFDGISPRLGVATEIVPTGAEDATVTFPRFRIRIQALELSGNVVPNATAKFSVRALAADGRDRSRTLRTIRTDGEGLAEWFVSDEGELTVAIVASDGSVARENHAIPVRPGVSFTTHKVILFPVELSAALQVRVECLEDQRRTPFLVRMSDPASSTVLRYLQPEEATDDGLFTGLPVGEYDLTLARRAREPLGMYLDDRRRLSERVVLQAHETTEVTFVERCGGRLRLTVYDAARGGSSETSARARAWLAKSDGQGSEVLFLHDEADGTRDVSPWISFGQAATTMEVLAPGTYQLHLRAEPFHPAEQTVTVVAGELTEIAVPLLRKL